MKQNDIAILVMTIVISAVFSFVVSKEMFPASSEMQSVPVVQQITSEFTTAQTEKQVFGVNPIDPTQLIQIGQTTNSSPFNGSTQ